MAELSVNDIQERLKLSQIELSGDALQQFIQTPDVLPGDTTPPTGYKLCRKCQKVKKITLFNKNKDAKDYCTSQCKECQKANANKSYKGNKHKRRWKQYYQEHKEERREQSRAYYQEHKEERTVKHAAYRATPKGRKAMARAHSKRAKSLKENVGIPYTRELVLDRDKAGGTEPICYLCGLPITGTPHLDHVIPVVMGGSDCFTNIACTHDACNLKKSKDAREITTEQVDNLLRQSEDYMNAHPEDFAEMFEGEEESTAAE